MEEFVLHDRNGVSVSVKTEPMTNVPVFVISVDAVEFIRYNNGARGKYNIVVPALIPMVPSATMDQPLKINSNEPRERKLPRLQYLLVCLIEEAAEMIQATCKALRFGLGGEHKDGTGNLQKIADECGDVCAIREMLNAEGVYLSGFTGAQTSNKRERVESHIDQFTPLNSNPK